MSLVSTLDLWFKNHYSKNERMKAVVTAVKVELMAMSTENYSTTSNPSNSSAHDVSAEPGAGEGTCEPAKKTFDFCCFKKPQEAEEYSLHSVIENEIQSYLMILEVDSDLKSLDWWKTQIFPDSENWQKKNLCQKSSVVITNK